MGCEQTVTAQAPRAMPQGNGAPASALSLPLDRSSRSSICAFEVKMPAVKEETVAAQVTGGSLKHGAGSARPRASPVLT